MKSILLAAVVTLASSTCQSCGAELAFTVRQITFGPQHHFFGYIGHVQTIPWNRSGRYIVALRSDFQDHLPRPSEAADVILIDTANRYEVRKIDRTFAWNLQQGTMLYWNPLAQETQFFFNDRDLTTGKVFTALFDIAQGKRVAEFRFDDTPLGNSGVAQNGGFFLGLNYGRLARLRPVTGYPEAFDWTEGVKHPHNDGIFKVNTFTGEKQLLVSYRQLGDAIRSSHPQVDQASLFINHTLWNRTDDRIYFYARAGYDGTEDPRINLPFTVNADGSQLTQQSLYIGGHPEWELGHRVIGTVDDDMVLYDTDTQKIVSRIGTSSIFPKPGGDNALSPDAQWIVSGYNKGATNAYVVYRRSDGASFRTRPFDQNGFTSGPLRNDPAPCWNRDATQILFPSIADDAERTRQLFLIELTKDNSNPDR